jgi:seryl-tRNA synthetase
VGGEEANVTVRTWGQLLPHEQPVSGDVGADAGGGMWERKPHWELAEALDIIDNGRGAKIAGSGFPVYKGAGSRLQRALISWFLDVHVTEHGFTEVWPPAVVNQASARGTGQIPDKEDQMYVVTRDDLYLVPTAEVPVTNLHRDEILEAAELPIRYAAYSPCFRREAGAAGKDTRGMFRVHQFNKVEMFVFVEPETSWDEHERMLALEEELVGALGLPYRIVNVAAGDLGASAAKKYDIEAWFPFQERYREITSCSNTTDYQSRRLGIRYRSGRGLEHPHTLNGTMVTDRALLAILENLQGGVPEVLLRYGAPAEIRA